MRSTSLLIIGLTSALLPIGPALATPAGDATAFVTSIIDKFNKGDANGFVNAHENNAVIIDEFGAHIWNGTGTARQWLSDFMSMSKAEGISGGHMDYGKPLRADSDGKTAYIVLPTKYSYVQKGVKMSETSSLTFVVRLDGSDWKIAGWSFAGEPPQPGK